MINVKLMGPFEAEDTEHRPIRINSQRSQALLACLAVDEAEGWPRSRLASLLWTSSEPQARSSLRQELARLRRLLGKTVPKDWGNEQIVRMPRLITTDITLWRRALEEGDANTVVSLWRGELLQGCTLKDAPFVEWLSLTRQRFQILTAESLETTLETATDEDRIRKLEGTARKLASIAPVSEVAHRFLMRILSLRRDIAGVVEQYQQHAVARRAAGLGEPSDSMTQLLEEIVGGATIHRIAQPPSFDDGRWIAEINRQHVVAAPPKASLTPLAAPGASIAVIPFMNFSREDVSSEALADGLTEEVISALARLPGVFVIARQTSMVYKNVAIEAPTIASQLGVKYLVEGSFECQQGAFHANVRLIDGRTGFHIWADSYDAELTDLFHIRRDIVSAIAGQIQPELMLSEINRATNMAPKNLDAWTLLQRANAHVLFMRDPKGLAVARRQLTQALAIAPDYAMARALLAAVHTWRALWSKSSRLHREHVLAVEHAAKAHVSDPNNSFVLTHCADTMIYSAGNIDLALDLLNSAVKNNPFDAHGYALLANANRVAGGNPRESLRAIAEARRISPRDPRTHRWLHYAGWCYWVLGELDQMEAAARSAIELYSDSPAQWIALTCALGLSGKIGAAKEAAKVLRQLSPTFTAEGFYDLARRFYGARFQSVRRGYRQLHSVLNRAL